MFRRSKSYASYAMKDMTCKTQCYELAFKAPWPSESIIETYLRFFNIISWSKTLEKLYDNERMPGLMYFTFTTKKLLNSEIKDMIKLVDSHDEVFIVKEDKCIAPYNRRKCT
jgi:hypothetical protein